MAKKKEDNEEPEFFTVTRSFRDKFTKHMYQIGEDVSSMDEKRLQDLVKRGLVESSLK